MATDNTHQSPAELAALFRQASRLMARASHHQDHAHHAQHRVLSILLDNGSMAQGDLLERLDVRSSSLSEVLRKLEAQGLILRERNEADRRSFILSATEQAKALGETFGNRNAEHLFDCLDNEEQEQLRIILKKLVTALRDIPSGKRCGRGSGQGRGRGNGFGRGRRGRQK